MSDRTERKQIAAEGVAIERKANLDEICGNQLQEEMEEGLKCRG